jgi:hypothetical protein
MLKRLLASTTAIVMAAGIAVAANLSQITGPQDPSQLNATINALITSINTGVNGVLANNVTSAATTATTAETTLQQYTLPANTLSAAGQSIRVRCFGTTGANANNKTMKLYFGPVSGTTATAGTNNKGWFLDMLVTRGAVVTTDIVLVNGQVDTTAVTPQVTTSSDSFAVNQLIKCTGTNGTASANDIVATQMIVEQVK